MKKHFLVAGMLSLSAATAFGAGYQLNLQGLRQLAMGGSGTAIPWDMSTIFYNPGALTEFENVQAYASGQFIMPNTEYVQTPTGDYKARTQSVVYPTFNVYLGGPVVDKSPVSIGLGVYTPFGSGTKWQNDWTGRYINQNIYLHTIFFQPTVAYRFNDIVSVGAGFIYAIGGVKINQAVPVLDANGNDGSAELKGDGHGLGFNVGVNVRAGDRVHIGIDYRSRVNMKVKRGYARFTVPTAVTTEFPYTPFSSSLPMPQVLSLGIGIDVTERLTIQADVNFVGWSAYDTLAFDYLNNTSTLQDTKAPRRYKNTLAIRLGAHYKFSDKIAAMIGGAWDPSPVRDGYVSPDLPDANRGIFTAGLTYNPVPRLTILGAAEFVSTIKRDASYDAEGFSGRYQTKAFTPAIGVSYDF